MIAVLSVPFLTLVIFQATWTLYVVRGLGLFGRGSDNGRVFVHEILGMVLALIAYPRVVQWLSFHLLACQKSDAGRVVVAGDDHRVVRFSHSGRRTCPCDLLD